MRSVRVKGKRGLGRFLLQHIGGDFLLIYELDDAAGKGGSIVFVRTGTHAELFNE